MTAAATASAASWDEMRRAYEHARAAEDAYDAEHILPFVPDDLPIGPERNAACGRIPEPTWEESARLQDIRVGAEEALLARPSQHAAAFALKVLICRGRGRDLSDLDGTLEAEAAIILAAHPLPGSAAA